MKFLRRKSGRDEDFIHVEVPTQQPPAIKRQPSPAIPPVAPSSSNRSGPSPPPKDLQPPPLYARYARMASTASFESLNGNSLGATDAPSASRLSAYNGSTTSGFGPSLHSATPSADSHATGTPSYGRTAGASLFNAVGAGGSRVALGNPPAKDLAKPEPIKLKPRRRKFGDDALKVTSTAETAKSSGTSSLTRASTASSLAHGSSDPTPNGTLKPPVDGYAGATNGLSSKQSVLSNGTSSVRAVTERPLLNGSNTHSTIPGANNNTSISSASSRSVTAPMPTQKSILQTDDDSNDVFSFYNAAVRMSENPPSDSRPPSPVRPKEGPPIALLNRAQKAKATSETATHFLASPAQNQDEIIVKPPSRRESLQHAAKAALESVKPAATPNVPIQRAPSPAKTRTVVSADPRIADLATDTARQSTLPLPSSTTISPAVEGGMAGVGAGSRFSVQMKSRRRSTQERPAPGIVFPNANARSPSPTGRGRITASPSSTTSPSEFAAPSKETPRPSTPEERYPTSIADKTPLVRNTLNASPSKVVTPSSLLANSAPEHSSPPVPFSPTSSISTVRQSRIHAANGRTGSPTPDASFRPKEEPTTLAQPTARHNATARSSVPIPEAKPISYPWGTPLPEKSFTASRQNSANSVASSSVPSATRSASVTTAPNGRENPDEMSSSPLDRSPDPVKEASKITLMKSGGRINGVAYSRDSDITPSAPVSPVQRRQRAQEPAAASRVREDGARRQESKKSSVFFESGYQELQEKAAPEVPVHAPTEEPSTLSEAAQYASDHGHGQEALNPPQSLGFGIDERSTTPASRNSHDHYVAQGRRAHYIPEPDPEPEFDPDLVYPIKEHLAIPELLAPLVSFMTFSELLALTSVSKAIRNLLEDKRELREEVLERYLGTVGYMRWDFGKKREPLVLTLRDLNSYLRGVSIPIHRYAEIAEGQTFNAKDGKSRIVRLLASSTRAYSKVVLRLRLQAEMEITLAQQEESQANRSRPQSPLVRAQSPPAAGGTWKRMFHSPLYRIGHAPLLRVFVPSPDGPWLSDTSVLACEKELKRAGITQLLKIGDVIWDTAVSDDSGFGNVGRLIWDGNYLIDLDYTFSTTGDIPPYLHSLSFPPAYFHKVLRSSGNPIMQMDLRPWGREIASNLQLVQDRVQAETPQGGRHTVMRWTHRTRFLVTRGTPIPDTNLPVDAGWEGTIVLEAEGTNEGLADLQLRCGMEWFKPQPGVQPKQGDGGRVFRLIRERSRPGEIWLRTVRMKERIS